MIEVNRIDRATRYRLGKTEPLDAEAAARAVLAGIATAVVPPAEFEQAYQDRQTAQAGLAVLNH